MTQINVKMDNDVYEKVHSTSMDLGLDISAAINLYLRQIFQIQGILVDKEKLPARKQAKPGGWEGKIWMSDDFNEPMEEFKEYCST